LAALKLAFNWDVTVLRRDPDHRRFAPSIGGNKLRTVRVVVTPAPNRKDENGH
jgi:hypothetical protein